MRRQTQTVHPFRSFIYSFPTQQDCVFPVLGLESDANELLVLTQKARGLWERDCSFARLVPPGLGLELRRNEDGGVAGVLYATAISYQVATEAAHRDYRGSEFLKLNLYVFNHTIILLRIPCSLGIFDVLAL